MNKSVLTVGIIFLALIALLLLQVLTNYSTELTTKLSYLAGNKHYIYSRISKHTKNDRASITTISHQAIPQRR